MTQNTAKKADTYRLQRITTPETLECNFNTVLSFGTYTLLAGYHYTPKGNSYYGAVYRFTTSDHTCEGKVELVSVSDEMFEDNGHAIAWAMTKAK